MSKQSDDITTKKETMSKPTRVKKSSLKGDAMFLLFLSLFTSSLAASFRNQGPKVQAWEIWTLEELTSTSNLMGHNIYFPLLLCAAYLLLTFSGQHLLRHQVGFDKPLRLPLALWSLLLALFSWAGAIRTVPVAVSIFQTKGWYHLVCGDTRHEWLVDNPAGFWTFAFCLSKVPELIDTLFIVLRKKELIALHWYHHFTVLLFCWQSWAIISLPGIVFAAMNLTVHSLMYTFYCLTALGYRPTTFAMLLTLGQIAQMAVGTSVSGYVVLDRFVWHASEPDFSTTLPPWFHSPAPVEETVCLTSSGNMLAGLGMYLSYLFLFVHFFVQAYCVKRKGK